MYGTPFILCSNATQGCWLRESLNWDKIRTSIQDLETDSLSPAGNHDNTLTIFLTAGVCFQFGEDGRTSEQSKD